MQAITETLFDTVYLTAVITPGIRMIQKSRSRRQYRLSGNMAVVPGLGDSFHSLAFTFRSYSGPIPSRLSEC